MSECPEVDFDPFADDMLEDPFAAYEQIRAIAPIAKLKKYDCWAVLDYEPIVEVLNDYTRFSSAAGVGIENFDQVEPWRPKSIILETDPPEHDRARKVLTRILSRRALDELRGDFALVADKLVREAAQQGAIDGVTALAEKFPLGVFPDALGVIKKGRENLLPWGTMVFNSHGPRNGLWHDSMRDVERVKAWIMKQCARDALDPDGLGSQVYKASDTGEITEDEAGMLVRSLLSAGLDTTVNAIASTLSCLARFPDQWKLLQDDPSLVRSVLNEVLRFEGAVTNFFRTTTQDIELAGYSIPANEKVLVLFAAGNRDPKRWQNPSAFNIERDARQHVGFGVGIHKCVGQMVARLEVEILLKALLDHVERIELVGSPKIRLNNTLRGLERLPLQLIPKAA